MNNLVIKACILLFALPIAALAGQVTVTTHTTGMAPVNNEIMAFMGLDPYPGTEPLPFELTLTATFYDNGIPSAYGVYSRAPVVVEYRIRTQVYRYEAVAESVVGSHTNYYNFLILYTLPGTSDPSYSIRFQNHMNLVDFQNPGPLVPFEGANLDGDIYMDVSKNIVGQPQGHVPAWTASGPTSLLVSPIPEPASLSMVVAGLLLLGVRRYYRDEKNTSVSMAGRTAQE